MKMNPLNFTHIIIGFLLQLTATSYTEANEGAGSGIRLSVVSSCENSATLYWSSTLGHEEFQMCELTVYETGQLKAQIIDVIPDSKNHRIKLYNLHIGHSYSSFLVCDRSKKTNIIEFIFGKLCESITSQTPNHTDTSHDYNQKEAVQVLELENSQVEWAGAIILSTLGVILIAAVFIYFGLRKYRHRQRILRIFRQEQNDPFQALYSPSQDSYSV